MYICIYIYIYIYIYDILVQSLSKRVLNIKSVNIMLRQTIKSTTFFGTQSFMLLAQQSFG